MITVVPSLLKEVHNFISCNPSSIFLRNLSLLDIDHNISIPPYFNDKTILVHLAFLLTSQLGGNALEKLALDYLEQDGETDAKVEVLEDPEMVVEDLEMEAPDDAADIEADLVMLNAPPPVFMTPKKKKHTKVKEKLDDSFLRRSRRISQKLEGYKNAESVKRAKEKAPHQVAEPVPLAMIPPAGGPAPHLTKDILHGIGQGFLQIQSETMSAALLDKDDLDE